MYYLVSVKHTRTEDPNITLWGPDDCGYTCRVDSAGKYDRDKLEQHPEYYDNANTFPVPCAVINEIRTVHSRPTESLMWDVVHNTAENWFTLRSKALKVGVNDV